LAVSDAQVVLDVLQCRFWGTQNFGDHVVILCCVVLLFRVLPRRDKLLHVVLIGALGTLHSWRHVPII